MRKLKYIANEIIRVAEADKDLEKDVLVFFKENKNPSDKTLHEWAEKKDYNIHKVETLIYTFATKYINFLLDGRANKEGFRESDADSKELAMGIVVEQEHTPDKDVAKRISMDHLSELKNYYTRLKKMESK
jgi:hypothetical protein